MSNAGFPQSGSPVRERNAFTCQRVSAALDCGAALKRSQNAVTPVRALSSISLWLAVSEKSLDAPKHSITTAPSAAQDSASCPARKRLVASETRSSKSRAGSSPKSSHPSAAISPASIAENCGRIQSTVFFAATRPHNAATKPVAAASWPGAAKISCSAPRRSPPSRHASAAR